MMAVSNPTLVFLVIRPFLPDIRTVRLSDAGSSIEYSY